MTTRLDTFILDGTDEPIVGVEEVWLRITSWVGISPGAEHHYGQLEGYDENDEKHIIYVSRTLSKREAARLNKKEGNIAHYKEGWVFEGFDDRDSIKAKAKEIWLDIFPDGKRLLCGKPALPEEAELLAGVEDD